MPEKRLDPTEVRKLTEATIKVNERHSSHIPISPRDPSAEVRFDDIFVDVQLMENIKITQTTNVRTNKQPQFIQIPNPDGFFFRDDGGSQRYCQHIYLEGSAGSGKTTFCKYLLRCWCRVARTKPRDYSRLSDWEKSISYFKFVFFIPLCNIDQTKSYINHWLADTFKDFPECSEILADVLRSSEYPCLFIMDGLDEWERTPEVKSHLRFSGFPNLESVSSCCLMYTCRPWIMDTFRSKLVGSDRVIEIWGLLDGGADRVMENVLVNHFKVTDFDTNQKVEMIKSRSKHLKCKSLMKIPFFATAFVHLWYTNGHVEDSLTNFITTMIELLIEEARRRGKLVSDIMDTFNTNCKKPVDLKELQIPKLLESHSVLQQCIYPLLGPGKTAYDYVMTRQSIHMQERDVFKSRVGPSERKFLFRAGILSKSEGFASINIITIKLSFIHRLVMEYLAAIHVISNPSKWKPRPNFLSQCSTVETILEFGNIFRLIASMDPEVGCQMSNHIVDVLNRQVGIEAYRKTFGDKTKCDAVKRVFELLCDCLQEIQLSKALVQKEKEALKFRVEDLFLDGLSPIEVLKMTSNLLRYHSGEILTVCLSSVPHDFPGLTNSDLNHFFDKASSLQSLCISDRSLEKLSTKLTNVTTLALHYVRITSDGLVDLLSALKNNSRLQSLTLEGVTSNHVTMDLDLTSSKSLSFLSLGFLRVADVKLSPANLTHLKLEHLVGSTKTLLETLPHCKNLVSLHVCYTKVAEDMVRLKKGISLLKNLRIMTYDGTLHGQYKIEDHTGVIREALKLLNLGCLELRNVHIVENDIDNRSVIIDKNVVSDVDMVDANVDSHIGMFDDILVLLSSMTSLRCVRLGSVTLTAAAWENFLLSLLTLHQEVGVTLVMTNISDESMEFLRSSNDIFVHIDEGSDRFEFTKFPGVGLIPD